MIRPALQIVRTRAGVKRVAGMYLVITRDQRVFFFTDATVNIDPTSEDLAEIAVLASAGRRTMMRLCSTTTARCAPATPR